MVDWLLLAVYVGLGFTYKGAKYCAFAFICVTVVQLLALVFAVFALATYDCVTNPTTKNWLSRNHENIIILIHSAIVLLLIQKSNGVVATFCYNSINAVRDSLRIRFNYSRMAREAREKVYK